MKSSQSQFDKFTAVAGIGIAGLAIACAAYLGWNINKNPYYDWFDAMAVPTCIFIALWALLQVFRRPVYTFSDDGISRKQGFKESFYHHSEIEGYYGNPNESRNRRGEQLSIKTSKGFLTINSESYSNYNALRFAVTSRYRRLGEEAFDAHIFRQTLPYRLIIGVFALWMLVWQTDKLFHPEEDLAKNIATTTLVLEGNPVVEMVGSKHKSPMIIFKTFEHPDFRFWLSGASYSSADKSLLRELARGDTVTIGMERSDFESKLMKTREPSFWTKHERWNEIEVYQLSKGPKTYLTVENVIKTLNEDAWWDVLAWVLGIGALIFVFVRRW